MFRATKPTEEEDSDSDWDSLSGEAEPKSEINGPSPSPRPHPPTSPNTNSPHIQPPNVKNTSTPIKSNVKTTAGVGNTNLKPGKMYGKSPAVTTFVDRGDDSSVDKRQDFPSPPVDSNSNRISSSAGSRRKKEKPLEMNELNLNPVRSGHDNMGFHPAGEDDPPYDFKDALPRHETKGGRPEQKQNKMKKAYIRNQTPDPVYTPRGGSDHSWDDSDKDDGPGIFPSASAGMSNHKQPSNKMLASSKPADDVQEYGIDVDIPDDEACCVPYQKKKGNGYTYMFHHGKFQYYSVVPEWREPHMKTIGERTERWVTYFWQEFFGTIGLLVDFGLIFLLELIKFIFRKVLVRLLVGFIVVFGDHLLKPVLAALFNSFLQPSLSFLWNSLVGLRNAIQPLLDITREIVSQVTSLLKGFRLFELNWRPVFDANVNHSRMSHQRMIQEI